MVKGLWSSISPIIENIVKITSHHELVSCVQLSSRSIKSQREASCRFYFDALGSGLLPSLWASSIFLLILLIINFTRKGPAMSFGFCLVGLVWFIFMIVFQDFEIAVDSSVLWESVPEGISLFVFLFFNILTPSSVFPLFSPVSPLVFTWIRRFSPTLSFASGSVLCWFFLQLFSLLWSLVSLVLFIILWVLCLKCMSVPDAHRSQKKASDPLGLTGVWDGYESPCGCWESNLRPREEQPVFSTTEQ